MKLLLFFKVRTAKFGYQSWVSELRVCFRDTAGGRVAVFRKIVRCLELYEKRAGTGRRLDSKWPVCGVDDHRQSFSDNAAIWVANRFCSAQVGTKTPVEQTESCSKER